MRALLIHNPSAGEGRLSADELLAKVEAAGFTTEICGVKKKGLPGALARPIDLVIAAGGDGTVATVAIAMPDRDIPLAILALGTSNNIARSLGIPPDATDIETYLRSPARRALRIGTAEGPWGRRSFVEAVGLGPLAEAIGTDDGGQGKPPSRLRQGRKVLRKLLKAAEPLGIEVKIDGRPVGGDFLAVEVTNIALAASGLKLAPCADPGDDVLEVVLLEAGQRKEMRAWLDAPDRGPPPVRIERGHRVVLPWRDAALRIDDEMYEPPEGAETVGIEIEGAALSVVVPEVTGNLIEDPGV